MSKASSAVAAPAWSRWLSGKRMRRAMFSQDETAMAVKHQPKGSGKPSPKCTPATARLWPAMASQRSRTSVSSRR